MKRIFSRLFCFLLVLLSLDVHLTIAGEYSNAVMNKQLERQPDNIGKSVPEQYKGALTPAAAQQVNKASHVTERTAVNEAVTGSGTTSKNAVISIAPPDAMSPAVSEQSATEIVLNDAPMLIDGLKPSYPATDKITQFGYSFFRPSVSDFSNQVDVPVAADYLLGVGDRIVLTTWGSIDGSFDLEINRSGEIVLPKVGTIKVAGLPYGQLTQVIRTNMARVYKDFQLNTNLGKTRLIKIYIVGEVTAPGDYNLSSLTTVLAALNAAGGPTKNGTLRNIQIKRGGVLVGTVDLYDFFLKGDKSKDIRLQSGDTIFVSSIGPVAGIAGNVRRPAIFELKDEKNLQELLQLADGVNVSGFLHRVQVTRVKANDKKVVTDLNLDPDSNGKSLDELTAAIPIRDMDMVRVSRINSLLRNYVRLEGHVLRQGDYALKPGMRISDLLVKDNLLPELYGESAQLIRLQPPDLHPEVIIFSPTKALAGDESHNHRLQEFDKITLYSRWQMEEIPSVRISGDVQRPGVYRLLEKMTVRDLVLQSGNLKLTAYMKNAEITRVKRGGDAVSTTSINIDLSNAMQGNPKDNITLEPYDSVMIRRIPNWHEITDSYVTLKGEFVFPGVYPLYRGEKLSRVIRRAGGFTDKAYLPSAKFTRSFLRELQQARLDEILAREEINLAKKQGELASVAASKEELDATKAFLEGLQRTIAILKTKKAEGRMVIKLLPEEQFSGSNYDLELVGGDIIEVSTDPKVVSVFGQIYNPTSFYHIAGETVENYVQKTGGFTRDAEERDVYVIKADGTVFSRQMTSFFSTFMGTKLDSGDTIVVPQKIERIAWMREIKDIATILGQVALTAGVLIAAGL